MSEDRKGNILTALRRGQAVSGPELAAVAGVSRTAVWKQIEGLRELGYDIVGEPRNGYFLRGAPDRLYPWEVLPQLPGPLGRPYHHFLTLTSTNDRGKALALAGAPEGTLIVAEEQTAARGRLGRTWCAPAGGLWFSLLLRPTISPEELPALSPAVAAMVARALLGLGERLAIKWPNDLLREGRKVAGILVEAASEPERVQWVVVGLGLNVASWEPPPELVGRVAALAEPGEAPPERRVLLGAIMAEINVGYPRFLAEGFRPFRADWLAFSATVGRSVTVSGAGGWRVTGMAADIDEEGRLLVDTGAGSQTIAAGEVTLRD